MIALCVFFQSIFTFHHHYHYISLVFSFAVMIIAITAIYFSLHRLTQKNV